MSERFLEGRVALITGGASGMGRATALRLAAAGADIAIGSLLESQRAETVLHHQNAHTPADAALAETRAAIEETGVTGLALPLDVARDESVTAFCDAVFDAFGRVDILVNAAGSSAREYIAGHDDALWQRMIEVNLNGPYRTTKRCLPAMIEAGWGRIVNFSSTAGLVGFPMHGAYCASKTGLLGLTRCVALEGAPHGVTCNALCPGFVDTDSNYRSCILEMEIAGITDMTVEEYRAQMAEKFIPQKRFIQPDEVGAYVAFLCRDEAQGITGEALRVSAGSQW